MRKKSPITLNRRWKLEMDKFKIGGLGGTFDRLHDGHKMLISTAFKVADRVAIGLSTDALLANKKDKDMIQSYDERAKAIEEFITEGLKLPKTSFAIFPLNDLFGDTITSEELEIHISSEETFEGAKKINEIRLKKGLKPLNLLMIPLVTKEKGQKISSTDIREEIKKRKIE